MAGERASIRLSRREWEVANLIAEGLTDRQIAKRLFIAERTAEGHVQQIRNKLGFDTRSQIASWVTRQTLTPAGIRPAGATPRPVHNLPAQLTSFIGREHELREVRRLLQRTRLLTIVGPGGCGKTRLALQAAADVLHRFPDGAWFIELGSVTDPSVVPQVLAGALAIRETEGADLLDGIATELSTSRCRLQCLMILDNCEHLIEGCAGTAQALLRACPTLTILCTSREPLHVSGEAVCKLPPLSVPERDAAQSADHVRRSEAVQLFVDRASLSEPQFELDDANAGTVAEVCRRLDGIPLALELAATHVGLLSLEGLLRNLEDRIRLLRRRAVPSRQETLWAAVGWSYDLLSEPERRLFRRLSVLSGGFTLEAAEAVLAGEAGGPGTLQLITVLVDKSLLLRVANRDRYRMLETIRQYGAEQLAGQGEEDSARRRHVDYFLALAERAAGELTGPDQPAWLERLADEHDNLRVALELSRGQDVELRLNLVLALERFWLVRGHLTEGLTWFEEVLSTPAKPTATRARALNAAAGLAWRLGELTQARGQLEASLAVWRELGDQPGVQACLANLGVLASTQGDWEMARTFFEDSLTLARRLGQERAIALLHDNLGLLAGHRGDHETALSHLSQAMEILRRAGDAGRMANTLANLGLVALYRRRVDEASEHYAESLQILRTLGERQNVAECLEGVASIAASRGDLDRALRLGGAAAAIREGIGAPQRPWSERLVEEWRAAAHESVGPTATLVWEEGRALTAGQAIDLALEEVGQQEDRS